MTRSMWLTLLATALCLTAPIAFLILTNGATR